MAIQPVHEYRIARRDRIDPLVMGERLAGPQRMVPITAGDPFAGLQGLAVVLDAPGELLGRRRVPEIDRGRLETATDEARVTAGAAGRHERTAGLHPAPAAPRVPAPLRAGEDLS